MERRYLACMFSAGNDRALTRHICCLQGLQSGKWAWAELCLADIVWQWREEAWFSLHHVNLLKFLTVVVTGFLFGRSAGTLLHKMHKCRCKKVWVLAGTLSLQTVKFFYKLALVVHKIAHFTFNISRVLVFCKSKAKVIYLQELSGKQLSIALLLSVESDVT